MGVVRTNCLDCLDRTNAVQTLIGLQVRFSGFYVMKNCIGGIGLILL